MNYESRIERLRTRLAEQEICGECLGAGLGAHGSGQPEDQSEGSPERQCGPPLTTTEIVELLQHLAEMKRERDGVIEKQKYIDGLFGAQGVMVARALGELAEGLGRVVVANNEPEDLALLVVELRGKIDEPQEQLRLAREAEGRQIDRLLDARRERDEFKTRLADLCTEYEKLAQRLAETEERAKKAEDKIAQFIHGEDHPDQYVTKKEAGALRSEVQRREASLNYIAEAVGVRVGSGDNEYYRLRREVIANFSGLREALRALADGEVATGHAQAHAASALADQVKSDRDAKDCATCGGLGKIDGERCMFCHGEGRLCRTCFPSGDVEKPAADPVHGGAAAPVVGGQRFTIKKVKNAEKIAELATDIARIEDTQPTEALTALGSALKGGDDG